MFDSHNSGRQKINGKSNTIYTPIFGTILPSIFSSSYMYLPAVFPLQTRCYTSCYWSDIFNQPVLLKSNLKSPSLVCLKKRRSITTHAKDRFPKWWRPVLSDFYRSSNSFTLGLKTFFFWVLLMCLNLSSVIFVPCPFPLRLYANLRNVVIYGWW